MAHSLRSWFAEVASCFDSIDHPSGLVVDDGHVERVDDQVIALIGEGFRNLKIADALFLSINLVKSYVPSSYRKIGVESRSEAVRWGIENGMLLNAWRPLPNR